MLSMCQVVITNGITLSMFELHVISHCQYLNQMCYHGVKLFTTNGIRLSIFELHVLSHCQYLNYMFDHCEYLNHMYYHTVNI